MTTDQQIFVGKRIKAEREKSRLTQTELALLMHLDNTTVCRHENGQGITEDTMERYASVFKIKTHQLLISV